MTIGHAENFISLVQNDGPRLAVLDLCRVVNQLELDVAGGSWTCQNCMLLNVEATETIPLLLRLCSKANRSL